MMNQEKAGKLIALKRKEKGLTREQLAEKLLSVIDKLKQLYFVILGLVICNIPGALEEVSFIEELMNGKGFFSGLLNGCFAGARLVGVIVFAYGIAIYINKINKEKN